jgi:hypothetical protein
VDRVQDERAPETAEPDDPLPDVSVIAGDRTPRLHWAMMVGGPLGLALAVTTSLWSSSRFVERSVNVQVDTRWVAGEQLAIRTQIVGGNLELLPGSTEVTLRFVDAGGTSHDLGVLTEIDDGLSQGRFEVPALAPGSGTLVLHYEPVSPIQPFEEQVPIEVVATRDAGSGRVVVAENMLQWADDTDPQPEGVRIDVIPDGRLLAGFDNRVFVRVTDPSGRPWKPTHGPARIQVRLASGEFDELIGESDKPPVLYDGPVDALGLASVSGLLSSDAVRFEVQLVGEAEIAAAKQAAEALANPPAPPDPNAPPTAEATDTAAAPPPTPSKPPTPSGPKRRLRFVSFAGTVRVTASTDFAHPGDAIQLTIDAISTKRPAFVDIHSPAGAWIETVTPPLVVPREYEWTVPNRFAPTSLAPSGGAGPFVQVEAYQSKLRPEDTSAIARIQLAEPTTSRADSLAPLISASREQLSLPRVDKHFEIGRERAYLSHIETALREHTLADGEIEQARAFLIGSLAAVVHGPPQALNTRAREDETLAAFKRRWTIGIRWFLLGGGGLFILVMGAMLGHNQRKLERQTNRALGLVEGTVADEETLADQSLAIGRARREMLARGVLTIVLMATALLLTVTMLEALVWEY